MNVASLLDGIRQGMPVVDPTGTTVGNIRDVSGRAILIIEPTGNRVFWVEGEKIRAIEGGTVRLATSVQAPAL